MTASSSVFNSPLSVLSLNVDGLRDSLKRAVLLQWLHAAFMLHVFLVISLYAPNRNPQRNDFLDSVHTYVDPTVPTIFAGDFNSVFARAVDRRGSCVDNDSRESSVTLAKVFTNCCCVDVWRHLFPIPTWFYLDQK